MFILARWFFCDFPIFSCAFPSKVFSGILQVPSGISPEDASETPLIVPPIISQKAAFRILGGYIGRTHEKSTGGTLK